MKKLLVVVDMQNDFIDGALGTKEAVSIVPDVVKKILDWDGDVVCTVDTHSEDYLSTQEGKKLPVKHCILHSDGWQINSDVNAAIEKHNPVTFTKPTFGSLNLAHYIEKGKYEHIQFVGLCTDICVISNAMLAKAAAPEAEIVVDSSCCAGVSPQSHNNALEAMKVCQIEVI